MELLRHLGERHEVSLWAGRYRSADTYQELAGFPRRDVAPWQWLYATPRADVVITHSLGAHLLALRHPGVLCYIHTLRSIYQQRARRPDLWMRRALDRRSVACAAALATNSAYAAAGIQARYHRSAAVVPGGVSSDWFSIAARAGTYALYAGRLAPEKGLERLLAWSAELPLDLAIAGAGDAAYVAYLRAKAGPRVRWLGPLCDQELARAYASCRCVVLVSHAEEFGLAALEGMAAARPVIATPEGGSPELVKDGTTGYLVADAESFQRAVAALAASDELCQQLGTAGRRAARAYTWEAMADSIERLCQQLLETRRRAA